MSLKVWLAALAVAGLPVAAQANPELIQNGNFTSTTIASGAPTSSGSFEIDANGKYGTVAGWYTSNSTTNTSPYNILYTTGAGANVAQTNSTAAGNTSPSDPNNYAYTRYGTQEYIASGYNMTSPTGGNFVALDGDTGVNGYFSQSVSGLTIGTVYGLTFYWAVAEMASATATNGLSDSLTVTFGNATYNTGSMAIQNQGFSGWVKATAFFTATSTTQVLSFLSVGIPPSGQPPLALLDGVSLVAAPEPATWAIMVAGVAAVGAMARRRKARAPAAA